MSNYSCCRGTEEDLNMFNSANKVFELERKSSKD